MMVAVAGLFGAAAPITWGGGGADYPSTASGRSATASPTQSFVRADQIRPGTAAPRPTDTAKTSTQPAQRTSAQRSAAQPDAAQPDAAQAPSSSGSFSLVVKTQSGDIVTNVGSISVASNEPVDPPHDTAEQWNTAVWVRQSSYPTSPSQGTSYVYGHACHYHVCPFTRLKDVVAGDQVTVTTAANTLTYRIDRIGLSPKDASSLPSWASDSTVPNRLVLVTCAYEQGDTSRDNFVVVAQLQGA